MIKKSIAVIAAALLSASAGAADMYLRGGFNGWGTDHLLAPKGNGLFEARVTLSPGNHPFKVGSGDWSAEWTIAPAPGTTVAPGAAYRMLTRPGKEGFLFVRKSADYVFSVDLTDPATPLLRVARVDTPSVPATDPHQGHTSTAALTFATFDGKRERARFSSPNAAARLRSYAHSSTMQLRDPGPQVATYGETAALPTVRSGSLAFDALFALAGAEMRQNSVAQIRDGNYNEGKAIDCACFETGEKWHYVWTRDLSYAADLGLAMLDPERVMHSLEFKLSPWREGVTRAHKVAGDASGLQIIQDTGSGGSWPVSTDRVAWAFGAEQVLKALPSTQRKRFAARAYQALANTIENDRLAAFDKVSGLYAGEQSFLDWRDQSYAAWIVNDLAALASSKALSTNVAHYKALTVAASLAREHRADDAAAKYAAWAAELKVSINARLWLPDANMYSSLTAPHFDGAPMAKFDWLGQALAIVTGVADDERARKILANYPHGPMGAPVIYPQQQDMPVYHNRAIWPFVTAYGLKAAAKAGNVSVADAAYDTLIRGAALNLSNMENLEWLSGQPLLLDEKNPSLIGPVINSRRQLWSVGAYLGMVIENVFGITTTTQGIALKPFITSRLRREHFGAAGTISLSGLQLQGRRLTVQVRLPRSSRADGYYAVKSISVDGTPTGASIAWDQLGADSVIAVTLGDLKGGGQALRRVKADPYLATGSVFAPADPAAPVPATDGRLHIGPVQAGVAYNVYRDGQLAAARQAGGAWTDPAALANPNACYTVQTQSIDSGNRSHHSPSTCLGPAILIEAGDARLASNVAPSDTGARFAMQRVLKGWGKPSDRLTAGVEIPAAGNFQLQLRYHNAANQINLGISGAVKWMTVKDQAGRTLAEGVVQMPHARLEQSMTPAVYSTPLAASLPAGRVAIELSDFYNMSYLQSNSTFSAAGGSAGISNVFDLQAVRILRVK